MLITLKTAALALLAGGLFATTADLLAHQALADQPTVRAVKKAGNQETADVRGVVKAVDVSRNTMTIYPGKKVAGEKTFDLAKDAKVFLDDGTGEKTGFQEGKLADLADGVVVTLRLSADQKQVVRIWVEGPTVQGVLKAADPANHTITASVALTKGEPAVDRTFAVAKNVNVFIDDGRAKDKSKPAKASGLADLPPNAVVFLKLSADRNVVGSIRAEGPSVTGVLTAVDAAKRTANVAVSPAKGEPAVEKSFAVDPTAHVFIDDGKAKDKTRSDSLADLPAGAIVTLRLALDQQAAVSIRAEGASVHAGHVTAIDAIKRTITLSDKLKGTMTYPVMKGAAVFIDDEGEVRQLADVPAEAVVNLKLLADQKTVREIAVYGPTVRGSVRGDASNDIITLENKEGDKTFTVAKDAPIRIDGTRAGKLTDLIEGTAAVLRLSADQSVVREIQAEGPSFQGTVKSVVKDTITLTIGAKGGIGGEDKEFKTTKDTVVVTEIYGTPLQFSDLKADKEVVLRLSLDQKAAARITLRGE
jgi:hypothetical protein